MTTYLKWRLIGRIAGVLFLGILAGWILNNTLLGLCIILCLYMIIESARLFYLLQWLEKSVKSDIPPSLSHGLWGAVFKGIQKTQRYQTASRDRLKEIFDRIQESTAALDDGIVMIDRLGRLEWWNRAAEELLGFKAPDDRGKLMANLILDTAFSAHFFQNTHKHIELVSPVNNDRQLQITTTVYGEGSRLLLVRDITRINQLEVMRKDFVANVSHELRTPLTVISGYLETLQDTLSLQESIPPIWDKALHRMQEQSKRMQTLVDDLLLLSRLESVMPGEPENIKLQPLLAQIVADARELSGESQHHIQLICLDNVYIKGSKNELRSAFSNLVFNAVRYTPAKGNIQVTLKVSKKSARIFIEDNGVGIDPFHIPRLTERFYRIDKGRSVETGGTGLGLAIVKHVLIRHSGRLSISSDLGKGSRFTCHFPKEKIAFEK
ncbi:MAG: phosphate regulon sensor histidine kinase PhoR [Endozoicomonas sp. (ex Botrylloides leachii)]|nr:phosphate regulon sensor histidine kinase PhoR [Endozoicomonas sp. (ex Botrylloides leachii)]